MTVLVLPLIFVFTALTVLVFAFGARRLLGLRFSYLRTLIAGVLAFLIASPIITAISGSVVAKRTSVLPELWFVILGVTIALVVGMVFLVVAEALVPSGSVPGMVYVLRGNIVDAQAGLGQHLGRPQCPRGRRSPARLRQIDVPGVDTKFIERNRVPGT